MITSPGFPQPYRNGIDCTWSIQLSIGQLIQINFIHFDLVHEQPVHEEYVNEDLSFW